MAYEVGQNLRKGGDSESSVRQEELQPDSPKASERHVALLLHSPFLKYSWGTPRTRREPLFGLTFADRFIGLSVFGPAGHCRHAVCHNQSFATALVPFPVLTGLRLHLASERLWATQYSSSGAGRIPAACESPRKQAQVGHSVRRVVGDGRPSGAAGVW